MCKGVLLFVCCCVLVSKATSSRMIVLMKSVEIVNNYKLVNASANIIHYGSMTKYVADFRLQVLRSIPDLQVSTMYYVPSLTGRYDKAFYNRTINFCTYLRQPLTDRILKIIYEDLNQRGNLPKRCPIACGLYSFNTSFDGFRLPGFLPESKFRFDLNFHRISPYEFGFESHWYGQLKRVNY